MLIYKAESGVAASAATELPAPIPTKLIAKYAKGAKDAKGRLFIPGVLGSLAYLAIKIF